MKKTLSIFLSLLVAATMVLSFTGCSENSKFVGEWSARIDVSDEMNKGILDNSEELAKYFKSTDLTVTINFTFNKDGSYKTEIDEASIDALCDSFAAVVKDGFTAYFNDLFAEKGIDIAGLGGLDGALKVMGTSLEEVVKESVNRDDIKKEFESVNDSGDYKAQKGKLYTFETGTVPKEDVYETYEFTDKNTLVITGAVGQDDNDGTLNYPLTFTRK